MSIGILAVVLSSTFPVPAPTQAEPDLQLSHVLLLREAIHLRAELGPLVWATWRGRDVPILLRTRQHEHLISHPSPPADFRRFRSNRLGQEIAIRSTTDTSQVQAAYAVGGVQTVVISAPTPDYDPYLWVLKAAHEMFHLFQGLPSLPSPFVGAYAGANELTFPFPFGDSTILSSLRVEAEVVYALSTPIVTDPAPPAVRLRLLEHVWRLQRFVLPDSLQGCYKQWMEWTEGVARYTERELAALARDSVRYQSVPAFRATFASSSYAQVWERRYNQGLNPIRFVGEGVRGTVMFYYLGMGKAYALDRLVPDWKMHYGANSLDFLLHEELVRASDR